jgi:hypothetical protein
VKFLPGYLAATVVLYIAVSVWYDYEVHRIVHTTIFALVSAVILVATIASSMGKK